MLTSAPRLGWYKRTESQLGSAGASRLRHSTSGGAIETGKRSVSRSEGERAEGKGSTFKKKKVIVGDA